MLFKDEVRRAGLELGIPENLVYRQPFPGPGLGVRIIGEVTAGEGTHRTGCRLLSTARRSQKQVLDRSISDQYFAALTNMRSVGCHGRCQNL